jgi:hypothetical protein
MALSEALLPNLLTLTLALSFYFLDRFFQLRKANGDKAK